MKYFVVEAIATYHMKYLIAQPDDHEPEWCMDTVTCEEADDMCQNYLGEQILGYKEVDDKQLLTEVQGTYVADWDVDQIKTVFAVVNQMSDHQEKYYSFVDSMWRRNREERRDWCQPILTKEEYTSSYGEWLEQAFEEYCAKELAQSTPRKNRFYKTASFFYFFNHFQTTHLSKYQTFTDFKKCDKIYSKLIDTKINYNSSKLNASDMIQ